MTVSNPEELTGSERAALIGWLMATGKTYRTKEVGEMLGLSYTGAYYLMTTAARVLPVYQDNQGVWRKSEE